MARPKGAIGKKTEAFDILLAKSKFNPLLALIKCHNLALEDYHDYRDKRESNRISPMEDNSAKFLQIAEHSAKEIASYAYSKKKAIEVKRESPLDDMNSIQKLEAMKHAVKALELEIIKDGATSI